MLVPEVVVQDIEDWKLSEILKTVSDHGNRSQLLLPLFLPWLAPVLLSAPAGLVLGSGPGGALSLTSPGSGSLSRPLPGLGLQEQSSFSVPD